MSETILIVDDTPANLGVLVETLGAAGYQLMVAEDGEEALAQTAQTQPDLILLDVMMPDMDGIEVCQRLQGDEATRGIPVIFITAHDESAAREQASLMLLLTVPAAVGPGCAADEDGGRGAPGRRCFR